MVELSNGVGVDPAAIAKMTVRLSRRTKSFTVPARHTSHYTKGTAASLSPVGDT